MSTHVDTCHHLKNMPPVASAKAKAAFAKAARERLAAAEHIFAAADANVSGVIDATEIHGLFMQLLQRDGIEIGFDPAELISARTLDFDEFIQRYNALIERITGESLKAGANSVDRLRSETSAATTPSKFVDDLRSAAGGNIRGDTGSALPAEIRTALTKLDDPLVAALERSDVRLVRSSWILSEATSRMPFRQQLEALEAERGASASPLLSPEEAVALIRRGDRSVGSLTYGWVSPGEPDPAGERLAVLRRTLREYPNLAAVFWECAPKAFETHPKIECTPAALLSL